MYSTREAAQKLKVSPSYIRYLLDKGTLDGQKMGREWIVLNLDYTKKRRSKRKGGRIRISKTQLEFLKAIRNGWFLYSKPWFDRHARHKVTKYINSKPSTSGTQSEGLYPITPARKKELEKLRKYNEMIPIKKYDRAFWLYSPRQRKHLHVRNRTIYSLEDKGLILRIWDNSEREQEKGIGVGRKVKEKVIKSRGRGHWNEPAFFPDHGSAYHVSLTEKGMQVLKEELSHDMTQSHR